MIATIFSRVGIKGLISIGLALALALMWWQAIRMERKLDVCNQSLTTERANHLVTIASVELLQTKIEDQNASIRELQAAGVESAKAQAAALQAASAANRRATEAIGRLRTRKVDPERCETGDEVMGAGL